MAEPTPKQQTLTEVDWQWLPKIIHSDLFNRIKATFDALTAENADLRLRLLSAAGDDLCRLSQDEIKRYTSGEVQIPPREEFIPSCERFWEQTAAKAGVLTGCLTLAQLVAENAKLLAERDTANAALAAKNGSIDLPEVI